MSVAHERPEVEPVVVRNFTPALAALVQRDNVVETLARGEELDARHQPHPLIGNWRPFWDCHIEPDWLLIYRVQEEFVELYRTGSHADLFE